jgi:type I restriction enzyme, S subunit
MKFEKLGNIVLVKKGRKPDITDIPEIGSIRVLQIDDLRNDKNLKYTNDKSGVFATEDDVLIAWDGANAGTIGYGKSGYIGSTIALLRKIEPEKYSTSFIGKFLQSKFETLRSKTTGATIPHIDRKTLDSLKIPEISISDQLHIANILTQAENLIAQRKESIRLLDEFLKSAFLEMFGDPVYGEKYIRKTFGEISSVRQGLQIPIALRKTEPGINRYAYITNQFLNGGKIAEFIENPRPNVVCRKDDILMTRTGNTGIVLSDVEGVFHNNFFLIDYDRSIINRLYLVHFLKLPQIKAIVLKKASTTTIPDLNHGDFYKITLPLPPFDLQTKFAQIVESTEVIKTQYQSSLQELERLYGSLSQLAFKGELGAKDGEMMMAAEPKGTYQNKTNS